MIYIQLREVVRMHQFRPIQRISGVGLAFDRWKFLRPESDHKYNMELNVWVSKKLIRIPNWFLHTSLFQIHTATNQMRDNVVTHFDDLPNELLRNVFDYMAIQDLYRTFVGLNKLLLSYGHLKALKIQP
jgi:hypothetical protein